MTPLADGIYTAEQASRDSATVAVVIVAAWALPHLTFRRDPTVAS